MALLSGTTPLNMIGGSFLTQRSDQRRGQFQEGSYTSVTDRSMTDRPVISSKILVERSLRGQLNAQAGTPQFLRTPLELP